MGTRNLVMVINGDETKVAQYGQWDGYPSGVGVSLIKFLSAVDINGFKTSLNKCRFLGDNKADKEFIEAYNNNAPTWSNDPDNRTDKQKEWFKNFASRDLSDDVLVSIINSDLDEILLSDNSDFANDSLMCEWCYVVDLDIGKLEVYEGFVKERHEAERFSGDADENGYYPVRLVKSFDINNLPTADDFLSHFEIDED